MKSNNSSGNRGFSFSHDIKTENIGEQMMERHYHDLFEIYFLESGTCIYFIDNKSYQLVPGDIAIIPAGVIHNTHYKNSRYSRMLINFSTRFIPAAVMPFLKSIRYLYRNSDITDSLYTLFRQIETEYEKNTELSEEILCCYMHMLFFMLARNENVYDDTRTRNEYIENAVNYIQKNYSTAISLASTAKMFSVSPEHFSREFKKETGFGFCEYINLLRLKKAEQLLKQTQKISVTEVSEQCGFNDSNYFSVKFKKMYGMSPKKMQQCLKEMRQYT